MKAEDKIQQEIFVWFNNTYCLPSCKPRESILHVPNEGATNGKLTSIGLYSGASDLILSWKGKVLFCEIKAANGKQSTNQAKFESHMKQSGFTYFIVRSKDEFKEVINSLLF